MTYMEPRNHRQRFIPSNMVEIGFALIVITAGVARAAQPGDAFDWSIPGTVPAKAIRLRFCPAGTIYAGPPRREANPTGLPPTKVREFYFGGCGPGWTHGARRRRNASAISNQHFKDGVGHVFQRCNEICRRRFQFSDFEYLALGR